MDFTAEVEEYLPESRQDVENLGKFAGRLQSDKSKTSGSGYAGKGKASSRSFERAATEPIVVPKQATSGSGYAGKGKASTRNAERAAVETMMLPKQAIIALQNDSAKAALLSEDLRHFADKFRIAAECDGISKVVLRPTAWVSAEDRARARAELKRLLDHHFPEQRYREVRLNVSDDRGACIQLQMDPEGYLVDSVEDYPGQDFWPGEVIIEINGVPLAGLEEEQLEDAFGNEFGDGASLLILTRASDET
jgi:hypothetical protein